MNPFYISSHQNNNTFIDRQLSVGQKAGRQGQTVQGDTEMGRIQRCRYTAAQVYKYAVQKLTRTHRPLKRYQLFRARGKFKGVGAQLVEPVGQLAAEVHRVWSSRGSSVYSGYEGVETFSWSCSPRAGAVHARQHALRHKGARWRDGKDGARGRHSGRRLGLGCTGRVSGSSDSAGIDAVTTKQKRLKPLTRCHHQRGLCRHNRAAAKQLFQTGLRSLDRGVGCPPLGRAAEIL